MENTNETKSKRYVVACVIALCCCLALGITCVSTGITAYLTATDDATNNFNVAYNEIEVVEDFQPTKNIKKVAVKNTGTDSAYVRVLSEFDNAYAATKCSLDFNTTDWTTKQSDGYYYYKYPLKPGATTPNLYTTITYASDADMSMLEDFNIYVNAESVSTLDGSTGTVYSSPQAAFAAK